MGLSKAGGVAFGGFRGSRCALVGYLLHFTKKCVLAEIADDALSYINAATRVALGLNRVLEADGPWGARVRDRFQRLCLLSNCTYEGP